MHTQCTNANMLHMHAHATCYTCTCTCTHACTCCVHLAPRVVSVASVGPESPLPVGVRRRRRRAGRRRRKGRTPCLYTPVWIAIVPAAVVSKGRNGAYPCRGCTCGAHMPCTCRAHAVHTCRAHIHMPCTTPGCTHPGVVPVGTPTTKGAQPMLCTKVEKASTCCVHHAMSASIQCIIHVHVHVHLYNAY